MPPISQAELEQAIRSLGLEAVLTGLPKVEEKVTEDSFDSAERYRLEIDGLNEAVLTLQQNRVIKSKLTAFVCGFIAMYYVSAFTALFLNGLGIVPVGDVLLAAVFGAPAVASFGLAGKIVESLKSN